MKWCIRCCYPSTKPNIWFNEDGLCSACIAFDERAKIDWKAREQEFRSLMVPARNHQYDCVVACSGGKDSTWQIVKCKELGLRPLAVTATTDHLSEIGRRNLDNIGNLCDRVEITPNKTLRRKMAKYALQTVGDISWCEHVLIWSIPAAEANRRDIPFVLYGECPQNEYGAGPRESQTASHMGNGWEQEFGGMLGLRLADMREQFPEGNFAPYRLPAQPPQRLFMGYFFKWDGLENARIAKQHGFQVNPLWVEGSACDYENLDNLQTGIHDYFRFLKYGYGRATDIVSSEIRRCRMTREKAVEIANYRDRMPPGSYLGVGLSVILGNLGMTWEEFMVCVKRFANRDLFEWSNSSPWPVPKFKVQ